MERIDIKIHGCILGDFFFAGIMGVTLERFVFKIVFHNTEDIDKEGCICMTR